VRQFQACLPQICDTRAAHAASDVPPPSAARSKASPASRAEAPRRPRAAQVAAARYAGMRCVSGAHAVRLTCRAASAARKDVCAFSCVAGLMLPRRPPAVCYTSLFTTPPCLSPFHLSLPRAELFRREGASQMMSFPVTRQCVAQIIEQKYMQRDALRARAKPDHYAYAKMRYATPLRLRDGGASVMTRNVKIA